VRIPVSTKVKRGTTMKRFVRDVAAAMLLFGAVGFAQAFVVVAPGETVAEKSQLQLSQEWWRWALGAPALA
jgi:hypothetical protein